MCLLWAYTTRMVSGWPMSRGQARCGSCQCLRERAPTRGLRKGAAANFKKRRINQNDEMQLLSTIKNRQLDNSQRISVRVEQ